MAVVADELVLKVRSDVTQAVAGLSTVERKAKDTARNIGGSLQSFGIKMTAAVTLPIVGAGIAALKLGADAQTAFANLEANAGITGAALEAVKDQLPGIASELGKSIPEAAEATFTLWSAGIHDVNQLMADTQTVLTASAIGLGDQAEIAGYAAVAYSNFGVTAVEAIDTLAVAAQNAIVPPQEMIKVFSRVSGTAAAAGVSLDDMAVAATILTNATGSVELAGTQLEGILRSIIRVAPAAEGALEDIGVSVPDFKKLMSENPIAGLQELDKKFADFGWTTDEWLMKVFPDSQAMVGAATLLGSDTVDAVSGAIENKQGTLDNAADIFEDTFSFKLAQVKATISNWGAEIGLIMIEMFEPYIPKIEEFFDKFNQWWDDLGRNGQENAIKVAGLTAAIGPTLIGLGFFLKLIAPLFSVLGLLAPLVSAVASGLSAIGLAAAPAALPILAVVAAIAGIIAVVYIFRDEIMAIWSEVWEYVSGLISEKWSYIEGIFERAKEFVMGVFEDIRDFVVPLWEDITSFISEMVEEIAAWFEENWPRIEKIIDFVFTNVLRIIQVALNAIMLIWDAVWPYLRLVFETVWNAIKLALKVAWEVISGIMSFWLALLTGDWEGAWNAIKGIFEGVLEGIKTFFSDTWDSIVTWWEGVWDKFEERWGEMWDGLTGAISDVFNSIKDIIMGIFSSAINWIIDKINYLIRKANSVSSFLNPFGDGFNMSEIPHINLGFGAEDVGGSFKVGDRGLPEIVNLPAGSSVSPLKPGENNGGGDIHVHLDAPQNDPHGVAREVGWELTKRGLT